MERAKLIPNSATKRWGLEEDLIHWRRVGEVVKLCPCISWNREDIDEYTACMYDFSRKKNREEQKNPHLPKLVWQFHTQVRLCTLRLRAHLAALLTTIPECSHRVWSRNGWEGCSGMSQYVIAQMVYWVAEYSKKQWVSKNNDTVFFKLFNVNTLLRSTHLKSFSVSSVDEGVYVGMFRENSVISHSFSCKPSQKKLHGTSRCNCCWPNVE